MSPYPDLQQLAVNQEYASLVYPLTQQEYQALKQSIEHRGLLEEITINNERIILDGHHRYKVCQELGIEPQTKLKSFDSPLHEKLYVIECNLKRRQLNDFQRAELALKLEAIETEEAKRRMKAGKTLGPNEPRGKARDIAAGKAGISGTTYERAKTIMGKAREEIIEKARAGRITIYKAFKLTNIEEKRQKLLNEAALASLPSSDNLELYLGDFREQGSKIPDNSVDLILTDPPYGTKTLSIYEDLAYFAARVLKPGCSVIALAGQYALPKVFDYFEKAPELKWIWKLEVIHTGSASAMYAYNIRVKSKPFLWYVKGAERPNTTHFLEDIIFSEPPNKSLHDWGQSPVEANYVIENITVENQIVLDPFMGSAEWGRAALKLKRKFIGIEIDPQRFEIAKANLVSK